jgi:hypothetical protein
VRATPSLVHNWTSLLGILVAASSFFAAAVLLTLNALSPFGNPYVGVLVFLIAPGFLVAGLLLIALGAWRERRRRRRLAPGALPELPRIDLNVPRQRRTVAAVAAVGFAFLLVTAVGSYQSYEYSESVSFCGRLCHDVMRPEFTAHEAAPHARVACAGCHVGPGASGFVRSKLSGLHQVYATVAGVYPRPIRTRTESLRLAQQTCVRCHWPGRVYGDVERVRRHFLSDEKNSPWTVRLLVKVGGGDPARGPVGGAHWHVNLAEKVEYVATDPQRQVIPWVRVTGRDGTARTYQATDAPPGPAEIAAATPRVMDCIDCHDRPSHEYLDPARAVDVAMSTGRLDPAIPFIKKQAVAALTGPYPTTAQALAAIAEQLTAFYRARHGELAATNAPALRRAVAAVQDIYRRNFFPEMRADWTAYPANVGHLVAPGCYRCHDGKHVAADGATIRHDCDACHVILAQGPEADRPGQRLAFAHPVDVGDLWRQMACPECHTGRAP